MHSFLHTLNVASVVGNPSQKSQSIMLSIWIGSSIQKNPQHIVIPIHDCPMQWCDVCPSCLVGVLVLLEQGIRNIYQSKTSSALQGADRLSRLLESYLCNLFFSCCLMIWPFQSRLTKKILGSKGVQCQSLPRSHPS